MIGFGRPSSDEPDYQHANNARDGWSSNARHAPRTTTSTGNDPDTTGSGETASQGTFG